MTPLLQQFLSESREVLEAVGKILIHLETAPQDALSIEELFRLVHTLKGCSGLFHFPEMTRVLHAAEDLMASMRNGQLRYSRAMADQLLDAMDFVASLCDEVDADGEIAPTHADASFRLSESLRSWIDREMESQSGMDGGTSECTSEFPQTADETFVPVFELSEESLVIAKFCLSRGGTLQWIRYRPTSGCFFQGEDPLNWARHTPGLVSGHVVAPPTWPALAELDAYNCVLEFHMLASCSPAQIAEHFRYVFDQITVTPALASEFRSPIETSTWRIDRLETIDQTALRTIAWAQRQILGNTGEVEGRAARMRSVATVLTNLCTALDDVSGPGQIDIALGQAIADDNGSALLAFLNDRMNSTPFPDTPAPMAANLNPIQSLSPPAAQTPANPEPIAKFSRRAEDQISSKILKVDQTKIDRLMDLIGEMVVSKNALPYLAQRAESQFGCKELSREIKVQYATINRIAEEMQDAIMQVRMMPVSSVFQRFPRLVRDLSHQLGKDIALVLEGEDTEADKNIVEKLADPLIHMVRNSLDHGLELPEVRHAAGKPTTGTITLRASQQADKVLIEIQDDGKGIDPSVVKAKALSKGLIDQKAHDGMTDREAVHLVFLPDFSTTEVVSDLSGRGVGMDVVRSAVEKIHGSVAIESHVGIGTTIRVALPLSLAVTKVMIVESDAQLFGVPMDMVSRTLRIPRRSIHSVKNCQVAVDRGETLPLKSLNIALGIGVDPKSNADDELAVLVVTFAGHSIGMMVDNFRGSVDVIQKPLGKALSGLNSYSGSALMGDGSVLMILDLKELL